MLAPIALFAFNREGHLRNTIDALAANDLASESHLTIFCDGPRNAAEEEKTEAVHSLALSQANSKRFASVHVVAQKKNRGLSASVIAGVTQMLEMNERVIVLEDDLITSRFFLRYMNDGLDVYADNAQVASIHGYGFPHTVPRAPDTFFLRGADCWGWGTWRRGWAVFEPDAHKLLRIIDQRGLRHAFTVDGAYDYYGLLEAHSKGQVSSWDVCWLASAFLADMWTLHPGRSLVLNVGHDSTGTHCSTGTVFDTQLASAPVPIVPIPIGQHPAMYKAFRDFSFAASGGRWNVWKSCIKKKLRMFGLGKKNEQ